MKYLYAFLCLFNIFLLATADTRCDCTSMLINNAIYSDPACNTIEDYSLRVIAKVFNLRSSGITFLGCNVTNGICPSGPISGTILPAKKMHQFTFYPKEKTVAVCRYKVPSHYYLNEFVEFSVSRDFWSINDPKTVGTEVIPGQEKNLGEMVIARPHFFIY